MRIVFAGTPDFAARALSALIDAGHEIALVLTQPDRPAGRGMKAHASAVKHLAQEHGIAVYQPERLKDPVTHETVRAVRPELMVVAAYGLILPQAVLDIPPLGCLNIHGSLLPRWRGAAPIQRAIEAGDAETGVTIMQMEAGLDTGPMLIKRALPIAADDNAATLHDKLAALGAELIVDALTRLGQLSAQRQPTEGVTYAHKIEKSEGVVNWHDDANTLSRRMRAFNPFPGMAATLHGTTLKLWQAHALPSEGLPGTILCANDSGVVVATGTEAICVTQLQKPGGKRLPAREFLQGFALADGDRFDLLPG